MDEWYRVIAVCEKCGLYYLFWREYDKPVQDKEHYCVNCQRLTWFTEREEDE